jgi:hypothetical protein
MRTATLSEEHVREALPGRAAQGATWMSPTQKKAQEAQHLSLLPSGRPVSLSLHPPGCLQSYVWVHTSASTPHAGGHNKSPQVAVAEMTIC